MSRRRASNEAASLRNLHSDSEGSQTTRPSGSSSLLEARNLVISDGQFNSVQGHHTNLVINLNQNSPTQSPFRNRITSNVPSIPSHRNTRSSLHGSGPCENNRSQTNTREGRPRVPENSASSHPPVHQSNVTYQRHLELKGRGFPLWIPPSNQNLPIQYRRTGVRIGDVGIITPDGGFSFLFNICLPHDDPVNPRVLPEHFSPIFPPIEATSIDKFLVFGHGTHLASASIEKAEANNSQFSGFHFESSASEGAILTMPLGATSESLGDIAKFRRYTASNIAHWYKFVNGTLGREVKNGDIRLVVGCDKTTTWGIATFANQSRQSSCRLRFGPPAVPSSDSVSSNSSRYVWEYSGIADVRAGPSPGENNGLDQVDDPGDVVYENQCLFLRTLNTTLRDDIWSDIHCDSSSVDLQLQSDFHPANDSASTASSINRTSATKNKSSTLSSHMSGNRRCLDPHSEINIVALDGQSAIFDSGPLSTLTNHPSKALNDILMAKESVPAAHMVTTHDEDWSFVASKYDTFPDPHELLEQILVSHCICEEDGVVFLDRREASGHAKTYENIDSVSSKPSIVEDIVDTNTSSSPTKTSSIMPFSNLAVSSSIRDIQECVEFQAPSVDPMTSDDDTVPGSTRPSVVSKPQFTHSPFLDSTCDTAPSRVAPTRRSQKTQIPRHSYVGPSLDAADEPVDEEIEFENFKMRTRMEKIYEFHEAAALAEASLSIEIYEARKQLKNSKEEDALRMLEHQTRMLQLRTEKEEERKAIVKSERAKHQSDFGRHLTHGVFTMTTHQRSSTGHLQYDQNIRNTSTPDYDPNPYINQQTQQPATHPPASNLYRPVAFSFTSGDTLSVMNVDAAQPSEVSSGTFLASPPASSVSFSRQQQQSYHPNSRESIPRAKRSPSVAYNDELNPEDPDQDSGVRPSDQRDTAHRSRLRLACIRCRKFKVKCEAKTEVDPCKRCFNGGHECIFPTRKTHRTLPKRERLLSQIQSKAKEIDRLLQQLADVTASSASNKQNRPNINATVFDQERPPAQSSYTPFGLYLGSDLGTKPDENNDATEDKAVADWITKARQSLDHFGVLVGIGGTAMPQSYPMHASDDDEFVDVSEELDGFGNSNDHYKVAVEEPNRDEMGAEGLGGYGVQPSLHHKSYASSFGTTETGNRQIHRKV